MIKLGLGSYLVNMHQCVTLILIDYINACYARTK